MPFPQYRPSCIFLRIAFATFPAVRDILAPNVVEEAISNGSQLVPVRCRVLEEFPEGGDLLIRVTETTDTLDSPLLFVKSDQWGGGVSPEYQPPLQAS